ncbi:18256_t:CDS:2 [Funneliformis geosporum]|uniref:18563_t:CDS:1 n=1 Tax=Funneliformis geosporum TaxID=1117311 RepID=A0A9W4T0V3_9GLOM|nr:18563_t:CDS:2 [Funneliformis geosporum]CAI2191169.1 18256_t:CDS:2 [Funneliformis geosporum]
MNRMKGSLNSRLDRPPTRYTDSMLGCIVLGEENAFPVDYDTSKTVGHLKGIIKEQAGLADPAHKLKLWQVNIPESEKREIYEGINIKEKFGGEKLDSDLIIIGQVFKKQTPSGYIHIIVELPATTEPFAKTISLAQIEKEVQDLFKIHSQDLEKVVTNKYDPYMYFEAPYDHPHKIEIDKKKIPMLGGNPNLLLYNLPRKNEDCLTDCEHLEAELKRNASSSMTIIMGTSGCGKTRLCLELLCRNYGLYFVAESWNLGSDDLELATEWTKEKINVKPEPEPDEAKNIAECAVWSCITGRLFLLNHLFCMAKERDCAMEPKSWLIFQLNHRLISELSIRFRESCDVIHLKEYCLNTMADINKKLSSNIFPVIYDEAQIHTSCLANKFPSYNNKSIMRPFFTVTVKIMSTLRTVCVDVVVCITGSGLSLLEAKDLATSNVAKEGSLVPTFNQFGQINTSEEILKLTRSILPLEEKYASIAIGWLKGRYRFTWTWIHYLIKSYDPDKQLKILKDRLTTDYIDQRNPRYSLYSGLVRLVHHPNERHSYINHESILEIIKRAITYYAMTGRRFLYKNTKEIDIMSIGFAHLETQELTGIIDEPLAIQAGINYFINTKIDNMWFDVMSQVNFNASMPGFIWEKCVTNFLHDIIFKSNKPLSSHKKLFPHNCHLYLPVDFENSPELLPSGKNRVGMKSVELSAPEEYIGWLRIVSSWEKTGNVSDGFCPICYPPNTAGPDISIAFFFPKREKREAYILNVQVKLRNNVELKKACKTVNPKTMFTDKDLKPSPSHDELREIYKQQNWDNRNIQMIVAYPCNFKRKRDYQKTPGASKRVRKIPRLIIDENNAVALISNDCQNWVKVLKQEQGSKVDWECSDIENSDDEE